MTLALENVTILDLSRMLPGPYCTMILSDLGANVIRVENPNDPMSNLPPFFTKDDYRESAFNAVLMRNKKSIALNLKTEEGKKIFYELVKKADVVMDTFRPKVMQRLKIDYETLSAINPSIICCSMTGYGQNGPYEQIAGHDINYIAVAGALDATRERYVLGEDDKERKPIVPGVSIGDIGGALVSAIGILGALFEREHNPERKGQYVDISMTDSVFFFNPLVAANKFVRDLREKTKNQGVRSGGGSPYYYTYKTKDNRYIAVGAMEPKFWQSLCDGLNRADLKPKMWVQGEEKEKVFKELENEFLKKTQKEWLEVFKNFDTCISAVKNYFEACEDPQILARNMIVNVKHPVFGEIQNLASPIKLSRTPPTIRSLAPKLGENTEEILTSLNYSEEDILNFKKNKVI
ncbi:MAG: CaiB/BaiF CoA transferase family protein [Promethearchaeota archaeon]|jgi:crotonobetainyl-CoA:carnitine CoA-transferase CaiB-like acyl-CoA transferase